MKKLFYFISFCVLALIITVGVFYFINKSVAEELRQIRQPRPNIFYVGIDISASIDDQTLTDLKTNIVERLKHFIGEETVNYDLSTFGTAGCGMTSVKTILSMSSPKDDAAFKYEVENKIQQISVAHLQQKHTAPLTTPLHCLLDKVLKERIGGRIIFFSDLINDDSDCARQYPFPTDTVLKFGENKQGQLIFLYPTPPLTTNPELNAKIIARQDEFINKMRAISNEGKVRAFFYHIPDEPDKRSKFIKNQLQNCIPTTTFEVVWERATRVLDTMVSAVRG